MSDDLQLFLPDQLRSIVSADEIEECLLDHELVAIAAAADRIEKLEAENRELWIEIRRLRAG